MSSFRNLSLAKQLGLFFALVFLIPTIVMGSFFYLMVQNTVKQNETELHYISKLQANKVLSVLNIKDTSEIQKNLSEIQRAFETLSKTGRMRFFNVNEDGSIRVSDTFGAQPTKRGNLLHAIRQILHTDEQIKGFVKDDFDQDVLLSMRYFPEKSMGFILQKNKSEIIAPLFGFRDIFLATVGLVVIFLIFLILFAVQFITDPIQEITEVAKRIERGDFQKQSSVRGKNEIGTLAHAFNTMSRELIASNQLLDGRVKEKTAKLQNALQIVHAQKIQDEALLSSISEGMIATDHDGRVLVANRAAENMFGWSLKEVMGKPIGSVLSLQDAKGTPVADAEHPGLRALKQEQKIRTTELLATGQNSAFPIEISAAPIILKGTVFGSILILTDITREKEIDRMKTEFIGIASHQLRGPLASLKWYGDWFAKGKAGKLVKTQKEFIDKMNISTNTMISLVDDFLNVSRIEQGSMKNEPVDVVISELVTNILSLSEHNIQEKQLGVQVENASAIKSIHADPDMIREILANFISNAIKYTPVSGSIVIRLSGDERKMCVEVENTGDGIPVSEQSKIFSKFYRASNMVKQGIKGTGLGLYTAKCLAESMGGSVGFESVEHQSTKFWVHLPIV